MKKEQEKEGEARRPYVTPKVEVENFYEETGVFGTGGDCSTHYCSTSGYCSSYNGNDCK
jgi:hypothetical protein